jgi:hypothetical protein
MQTISDMATIVEVIQRPNIKTFPSSSQRVREGVHVPTRTGWTALCLWRGRIHFVINSSPNAYDYLQISVMRVGEVTTRLHQLPWRSDRGARPLGNSFPSRT